MQESPTTRDYTKDNGSCQHPVTRLHPGETGDRSERPAETTDTQVLVLAEGAGSLEARVGSLISAREADRDGQWPGGRSPGGAESPQEPFCSLDPTLRLRSGRDGVSEGSQGGCGGGYLERIAKSFQLGPGQVKQGLSSAGQKTLDGQVVFPQEEIEDRQNVEDLQPLPGQWPLPFEGKQLELPCPGWAIVGECENGHGFAKELYCGREWCPVCGLNWSATHKRRFARWLPKARQIQGMAYLVITFPDPSRARLRDKQELSRVGKGVKVILQDRGIARGLRRWHWFGEQGGVWNPHLNILLEGGYRGRRWLRELRAEIASLVREKDIVIHYQFTRQPAKMVHWLKYITRATFLEKSWDQAMVHELYGFRNTWSWGKWEDSLAWDFDHGEGHFEAIESLENGLCPKCNLPLDWSRPVARIWLDIWSAKEIGAGYYELEARSPPFSVLSGSDKLRLHWLELIHRARVQLAAEQVERERAAEAEYQRVFWRDLPELKAVPVQFKSG